MVSCHILFKCMWPSSKSKFKHGINCKPTIPVIVKLILEHYPVSRLIHIRYCNQCMSVFIKDSLILSFDEFWTLIIENILNTWMTYFLNKMFHSWNSPEADNFAETDINNNKFLWPGVALKRCTVPLPPKNRCLSPPLVGHYAFLPLP